MSGSISPVSNPKYAQSAPDVKTGRKTRQSPVQNTSPGTGQQQDLQIRDLHGKNLQNRIQSQPISDKGKELVNSGKPGTIDRRSHKLDWLSRGASFCLRKIKEILGILRLQPDQTRSFKLDPEDPVVKMFFEGKLHNETGAVIFDRVRYLALNGTPDERKAALGLMMIAADQCDQDKRLSFYEEYYSNCMFEKLNRLGKEPVDGSDLSTVDRWIILSQHGEAATILKEMESGLGPLQTSPIETLRELVQ